MTNSTTIQPSRAAWHGPMVWNGPQLQLDDDWITPISQTDVEEIRVAVSNTVSSTKTIATLDREDFAFGRFGEKLLQIRDEVQQGRGFALLRGLPDTGWSNEELVHAYWGIGAWLGDAVSQNAKAHLLGHVIDQRLTAEPQTRLYQTNKAQPFHSDSCDIVGLLCLHTAKTGGASSIASSSAIHNTLLETEPNLLAELYGEFQCDRYGEIPAGKQAHYAVHIFNNVNGKIVCCGMDPDIRSAQRLAEVATLSTAQGRALDAFQQTARELALNMTLKRGDIQFVNNLTVVHARQQYTDHDEWDRRRYMVRLWLSSPEGRQLPDFLSERWGNIATGTIRGGIKVPGATPVATLNPDS